MAAEKVFELMNYMKQNGITFCYCGYMSEYNLASIGDTIKKTLAIEETDRKTTKTVFSVFVEQVQNVIRYSAQKANLDEETDVRYGILTMGKEDGKIFIGCGNKIDNADVPRLRQNLSDIQKMDRKALKSVYKQTLRNGAPQGSKGAGIGFVEIAMRATHGFDFEFTGLDSQFSFFVLKAYI